MKQVRVFVLRKVDVIKRSYSKIVFLIPCVCGLLGFIFAVQQYLVRGAGQWIGPLTWRQSLLDQISYWFIWAFSSPLILFLSKHFPIERHRLGQRILTHSVLGAMVSLSQLLIYLAAGYLIVGRNNILNASTDSLRFYLLFLISLLPGIAVYGVILVVGHTIEYYKKYQEEAISSLTLKSNLTQAQLQSLKMQLHPHFLFNTLHSISALVLKNENRAAINMISGLSDLLRLALENEKTQLVPLKQELDFLEKYLEIEKIRFYDRLTVEMCIAPQTLDAQVPNLILQPLVENAIRYGIAPHSKAGKVRIFSSLKDKTLSITVSDDGPGIPAEKQDPLNWGIGLKNTRTRLSQLYGEAHSFDLQNGESRGLTVKLSIPFSLNAEVTSGNIKVS